MSEPGFEKLINESGEENVCTFCQAKVKCLSLDHITDHLMMCVREHYTDDSQGIYDTEDGIFWGQVEPEDILSDMFLGDDDLSRDLSDELREGFGDQIWTLHNPYAYNYSWKDFSEHIKHNKRFFFHEDPRLVDEPVHGSPLSLIRDTCTFCKDFLIGEILPGQKIFRSRFEGEGELWINFEHFLPPPPDKAIMSNRMSPPGIPYLYCADTKETALAETIKKKGKYKTAEFEILKPMKVVNVTNIPDPASLFDPDKDKRGEERAAILLLKSFASEISKKIPRDDRAHIEYLPSQVFSEYLRDQLQDTFGIKYPSTQNPGGYNIAFFLDRESFPGEFLKLVKIHPKTPHPCP